MSHANATSIPSGHATHHQPDAQLVITHETTQSIDQLLNTLYNDAGAVFLHNGTFCEIVRIPDTFSDRVIKRKADPPIVPFSGVRIVGDRVEKMTAEELAISQQGCEIDEDGDLMPKDDGLVEAERDKEVQSTIGSDIFKSLPLVDVDDDIHHAKQPRTIQEVENLFKVRGVAVLVQVVGRTRDDQIVTNKFGRSLTDWMDNKTIKTSDRTKIHWAIDIARAISELHLRDMLHKDLTSNNVLVQGDQAILCDLESRWTTGCARAPEVCQGGEYDRRADIYGLGTLLWSIELKNMPRPHASLECGSVFGEIMARCLDNDPAGRPSIDEVLRELQALTSEH
ncbi:hypothetical protein I302_107088 [Kwoniella bestiolae CBS 10118]|uniref:TKL protein kinase n=1 Tax=Kwoniella bestiolae CBS 10118 TaxID=1296100 RepID=A0A1B9FZI6_9TREE|nr:TKL protein kinase [Kwoniella bestiolae CBS 10118]OCF24188.1 TKL protein kinase [Kwoniella bestiolae CBS 10118]